MTPESSTSVGSGNGMPRVVKLTLAFAIMLLMGGAVWLFSVRGEALLIDLYNSGARFLCL